tara:strand:- start:3967 stop:4443 length:477 start_codon:yes stop_codon:yes gene_type:complete
MFIRLFLIAIFIPLQSCSKTLIGEKLENSFDIIENPTLLDRTTQVKDQNKTSEKKEIQSIKKDNLKDNKKVQLNITKNISMSKKERPRQNSTKSVNQVTFNPQPYRIILKLSGANPSAPAESVTKALRKAGVAFEVEKIERFEEKSSLKDSSFKRKEF